MMNASVISPMFGQVEWLLKKKNSCLPTLNNYAVDIDYVILWF